MEAFEQIEQDLLRTWGFACMQLPFTSISPTGLTDEGVLRIAANLISAGTNRDPKRHYIPCALAQGA